MSDPAGGFAESYRELVARVERLEAVSRLLVAPIREAVRNLDPAAFSAYMDRLVEQDHGGYDAWQPDGANCYRKYDPNFNGGEIRIDLRGMYGVPVVNDGDRARLADALLTLAALSETTPRELLMRIDPTVFPSAVDALGAVGEEET